MTNSMNDSEFLLQRLQELKNWQAEQEERLLREQEDQMDHLYTAAVNRNHVVVKAVDNDDASTIDQDISSLADDNELEEVRFAPPPPAWAHEGEGEGDGEQVQPPPPPAGSSAGLDEMPIAATAAPKTFEELLSQELKVNQDAVRTPPPAPPDDGAEEATPSPGQQRLTSSAKPFLRRGSGLARYGGVSGSPNGVVRRIHSSGKINTRNFSKSSTSLTPKANGSASGLKASASCSKINSMTASAPPTTTQPKNKSTPSAVDKPTKSVLKQQQPRKTLKLNKPESATKKLAKGQQQQRQDPTTEVADSNKKGGSAYDSVELSFMEKLEKADVSHKKEMEDLAMFEMLEEAAADSSFCSSSSAVKKIIGHKMAAASAGGPGPKTTSTPKTEGGRIKPVEMELRGTNLNEELDQVADERLMNDIQAFLASKGAVLPPPGSTVKHLHQPATKKLLVRSDDEDEEEDTLKDFGSDEMEEANNGEESEEDWSDVDDEGCINARPSSRSKKQNRSKNVRFSTKQQQQEMVEAQEFSPPRMPKNSPSYLIWSIFTKEREERMMRAKKNSNGFDDTAASPPTSKQLYQDINSHNNNEGGNSFHSALLNAKLVELEKEIDHFKKENEALKVQRRKLTADKKQLAKDISEFDRAKEQDKKKLEEEKKRLRRDRALLEKSQKDKKSSQDKKSQEEIEDLQAKVTKVTEELERKECKWANALNKLQDQLKFLEKENQTLHEENHKLKLKGVAPKISTRLVDPAKKMVGNMSYEKPEDKATTTMAPPPPSHLLEQPKVAEEVAVPVTSLATADGPITPRMEAFSPAESLESNVTLVSAGHLVTTTSDALMVKEDNKVTYSLPKSVVTKKNSGKGGTPSSTTTEKTYPDGRKEICYSNGNRKEISADGNTTRVLYYNGDVKESFAPPNGLVKYFYSQTKTWHLTYPDGKEVLQFSNGQEEVRYPSGVMEISFSDGSVKKISSDGSEDIRFPDGTRVAVASNGDRTLVLANGQKEFHTAEYKRREYPDGTVKILYEDGRTETQYSTGRTRIKDKAGKVLHDSMTSSNTSAVAASTPTTT